MKQTEVLLQPNPSKKKYLIKQDCSLALLQVTIKKYMLICITSTEEVNSGSQLVKSSHYCSKPNCKGECEVPHLFLVMGLRPSPNDEYF